MHDLFLGLSTFAPEQLKPMTIVFVVVVNEQDNGNNGNVVLIQKTLCLHSPFIGFQVQRLHRVQHLPVNWVKPPPFPNRPQ